MLVLTRRAGESIMIDGRIELKVLRIKGSQVHIGIEAPRETGIHRKEVWLRLEGEAEAEVEAEAETEAGAGGVTADADADAADAASDGEGPASQAAAGAR